MPKPPDCQLKYSILLKSSFYPILFQKNFDDTYFIGDSPPPLSATQKAYADNYTKAEC